MGALLDIQDAEKLPAKPFETSSIKKLKENINKSFDGDKKPKQEESKKVEEFDPKEFARAMKILN